MFLSDEDRLVYLSRLRLYIARFGVRLWAWCLMNNHIHLLAVPEREDSLARALGRTHAEYAQYWNLRRQSCGHVWQARFFSCALQPEAVWEVGRYVELNPVRAAMVEEAEQWRWSSARAHVLGDDEFGLVDPAPWAAQYEGARWRTALRAGIADEDWQRRLEEATVRGWPVGSQSFVDGLECRLDLQLRPKRPGRPRKPAAEAAGEPLVSRQMRLGMGI